MPRHITNQTDHIISGALDLEDHGPDAADNRLMVPVVSGLPAITVNNGQMCYVADSGVLAVTRDGAWQTKASETFGSGISPVDTPQIHAWWDATESVITKGGDVSGVQTWADAGPNGFDLSINNDRAHVVDVDGMSGVYFDGDDMLENTAVDNAIDGNDQPVTVIMVYEPTEDLSLGTNTVFMCWSTVSNTPGYVMAFNADNTYNLFKRGQDVDQISVSAGFAPSGNKQVVTFWHNGTQTAIYSSGVAQQTAISGQDVSNITAGKCTVGAQDRPGFGKQNYCRGILYSLAVFTSGLSSEHRKQVETNLAYRYGVAVLEPFEDNLA